MPPLYSLLYTECTVYVIRWCVNIVYSDGTKETAVSKETTDAVLASPSVKRKETMAAVKTVS